MRLLSLGPEPSASANSAIRASMGARIPKIENMVKLPHCITLNLTEKEAVHHVKISVLEAALK